MHRKICRSKNCAVNNHKIIICQCTNNHGGGEEKQSAGTSRRLSES